MDIQKIYIPYHRIFGGAALAKKYGVSQATISDIVTRKSYREGI